MYQGHWTTSLCRRNRVSYGLEDFIPVVDSWRFCVLLAAVKSWASDFKGDAATSLLATISSFLDRQRNIYARHTCIVNSSGTGKSRMVDRLSMQVITVPMCLREEGTQGLIFCTSFQCIFNPIRQDFLPPIRIFVIGSLKPSTNNIRQMLPSDYMHS